MVVARAKGREIAETMEGHCVFGCRESDGSGISGDGSGGDIVGSLGTDEEAITSDNSVGGKGGALLSVSNAKTKYQVTNVRLGFCAP